MLGTNADVHCTCFYRWLCGGIFRILSIGGQFIHLELQSWSAKCPMHSQRLCWDTMYRVPSLHRGPGYNPWKRNSCILKHSQTINMWFKTVTLWSIQWTTSSCVSLHSKIKFAKLILIKHKLKTDKHKVHTIS